jgi:hypothetical protein
MNGLAELDKLIRSNEVSMELKRVATNPILADTSQVQGLVHYRCHLLRPGKRLDVYLSVRADDDPLTLFDVLFMLALDASGCDLMGGFEKYREKWNRIFDSFGSKPKEIELFWEELESRCRQTEKLIDFLGPSAYEELLTLFGLEEDQE